MSPDRRRIVAVEAHRRCSGACPVRVHSLGTGETFEIEPRDEGFVDKASGAAVHVRSGTLYVGCGAAPIDLVFETDVLFKGMDHHGLERFSGRAGGGAIVTIYDRHEVDFFQYAVECDLPI